MMASKMPTTPVAKAATPKIVITFRAWHHLT
jgi:hypothetical protein